MKGLKGKNALIRSWKTTLGGVGALLASIVINVAYTIDDDPATDPDWEQTAIVAGVAFGLSASRDSDVSSERACAR